MLVKNICNEGNVKSSMKTKRKTVPLLLGIKQMNKYVKKDEINFDDCSKE